MDKQHWFLIVLLAAGCVGASLFFLPDQKATLVRDEAAPPAASDARESPRRIDSPHRLDPAGIRQRTLVEKPVPRSTKTLVVQGEDGDVVPGASIQSVPRSEREFYRGAVLTQTDDRGRAILGLTEPWPDRIVVSHPDFIPGLKRLNRKTEEERVLLRRGLSIDGVLRDEGGRPMPGFTVQASSSGMAERRDLFVSNSLLYEAMRPLESGKSALAFYKNEGHTDSQGRFSIRGLPEATYHLNLMATRFILNRPSSYTAGSSGVELTAQRVSSILVRPTDASTGELMGDIICLLDVAGGSNRTTLGARSGGGEWRIGYAFPASWPKTLEVTARVQAQGFDDGKVTISMDRFSEETVIPVQLIPSDRIEILLNLSWASGVPCRDALSYSVVRRRNRSEKLGVGAHRVRAPESEGIYRIWVQKDTSMIRVRPASVPFASLGVDVELSERGRSVSASIKNSGTIEIQVDKSAVVTLSGSSHVGVLELKKGKNLVNGLPWGGWRIGTGGKGSNAREWKAELNKRHPYALIILQ